MGIGFWLRRLFGGLGRANSGTLCNLCHCDIPAAHLEQGVAVVIARQTYCRGCVEEITRRAGGRDVPGWRLGADLGSSSTIFLR